MEEAFHYCNIMTAEAGLSLEDYLRHCALTIHFTKKTNEIKMKFVKVWASPPSDKKKDCDAIARTVELSFKKTQEKLLEVMKAAWEDKQTPQNNWRKKFVKPEHLKTVSKFAKRGRLLIELLLGAIVLVDYCIDYTKTFNPSIKEEKTLLEFVRDFFRDESNFTNAWKLLEYLLRTKFWNDNGTLTQIRKNPVAGRALLDGVVYPLHPEKVRDWAVDTIHHHRKRKGDLFFGASVTEKDAGCSLGFQSHAASLLYAGLQVHEGAHEIHRFVFEDSDYS
jgi:hypothetical protein